MTPPVRLIRTGDGSDSLYNEELDETYHSTHGAVRESAHVFIDQGLRKHDSNTLAVLEYGFGTGLNALLTAIEAENQQRTIRYTTLEAFPIDPKLIDQLNYPGLLDHPKSSEWFVKLHSCPWEEAVDINDYMEIRKMNIKFEDFVPGKFDVIFYDAFAPSKQPEVWDTGILSRAADALTEGGIFVTYCARGQLKRDLASLGLEVETLAGPPGKKEMVRATKK